MRRSLAFAALLLSAAAAAAAQPPGAVDFRRDVQPIFRDRCGSCHGSEMQMGGLRLDRRIDALRGGTQTDIGPGNAEGSRLYHRVVGTVFGQQMPPGKPLSDGEAQTIRRWIDEGASWPDEASGETPWPAIDPDAARLLAAIRAGDRSSTDAILRASPRAAGGHAAAGVTPLMGAALYGDAALTARLLAAGADPNAAGVEGATALMWAVPDTATLRVLLDAGADVNAKTDDRRSALIIASSTTGASAAVRLLLEYGASPWPASASEASPLREAARVGDVDSFTVLREYGVPATGSIAPSAAFMRVNCIACATAVGAAGDGPLARVPPPAGADATAPRYDPGRSARPTPIGAIPATPAAIRAAVERSLPLLQDVGLAFLKQTGCASCHHNSLVAMAVSAARANGYTVDESAVRAQASTIAAYVETWRERLLQNIPIAGGTDTISYLLTGLGADRHQPDAATDALAIWLRRRQAADGHWPILTIRPPIESNDIEATAMTLRALQQYAPPTRRADYDAAIDRARVWLTDATAVETEERAFRLLGLSWAKAPEAAIARAARELLAAQREDGGWAQLGSLASDAYATGEALVALREGGAIAPTNAAYRKGVAFLLRTQIEDGSWIVETRAVPIQAYFESGFPYGVNQWVSAAATAWAVTALALAK